jgi:hypothetical protein
MDADKLMMLGYRKFKNLKNLHQTWQARAAKDKTDIVALAILSKELIALKMMIKGLLNDNSLPKTNLEAETWTHVHGSMLYQLPIRHNPNRLIPKLNISAQTTFTLLWSAKGLSRPTFPLVLLPPPL